MIPVVVMQHGEEAAFHWLQRDLAVGAPHYSLSELASLDDYLEAHLDGLRISEEGGFSLVREEFGLEESGEAFVSAVLGFEAGDQTRIVEVLEGAANERGTAREVISALGWLGESQARPHIERLVASESPSLRCMGIAAAACRRQLSEGPLREALSSSDLPLRSRALRAIGQMGYPRLLGTCPTELESDDERCRYWAAWSLSLLGSSMGFPALRETAETGGRRAETACDLVGRRLPIDDALAWQRTLCGTPENLRMAVVAARAIADPGLVPWLLEVMRIDDLARPAGEAFTHLTGLDLAYEDLETDWPDDFEAGPSENPEDEDVSLDPDEDLPWPDVEFVARWWQDHKGEYESGTRYLLGRPISQEQLWHVLRHGRQRQRAAAALELVVMNPGQPLFEVRAPGFRQEGFLGIR